MLEQEKKQPKEVAIEKLERFLTYMRIHKKSKYICKITVEYKHKTFPQKGFATIDMSDDSEFGNICFADLQLALEDIMEKKMFNIIEQQVESNKKKNNDTN